MFLYLTERLEEKQMIRSYCTSLETIFSLILIFRNIQKLPDDNEN